MKLFLINITVNACTSLAERFCTAEPELPFVDFAANLSSVIAITPAKAPSSIFGALDAWGQSWIEKKNKYKHNMVDHT